MNRRSTEYDDFRSAWAVRARAMDMAALAHIADRMRETAPQDDGGAAIHDAVITEMTRRVERGQDETQGRN